MKFERADRFKADWKRLSDAERERFRTAVRSFHDAAQTHALRPGAVWPPALRVRRVVSAPGIWEMTWSFSGPDGRATFEWVEIDGEPAIRWRRIGSHDVFDQP